MQGKTKIATCLVFGMVAAGLLAQPEFAGVKTARSGKQFTAARTASVAVQPAPQPEVGKVILVLQTRDHRVIVRSSGGGGEELRYSVATLQGIALADGLSVADLKSGFPELHEIVTGIAWAGVGPPAAPAYCKSEGK
jgi:hypothetical protein